MKNYQIKIMQLNNSKLLTMFMLTILVGLLYAWKSYETRMIESAKHQFSISAQSNSAEGPVITARRLQLEQMAIAERSKIKVMVEHDNSPLTNTYPMILDATGSYDPDLGDQVQYKWKQISGPNIELRPGPFSAKVSFEGIAGEYEFELTVSDNYGAENTIVKSVIIEREPNVPPVIDMKIRQGSV
mgnify:FL=1